MRVQQAGASRLRAEHDGHHAAIGLTKAALLSQSTERLPCAEPGGKSRSGTMGLVLALVVAWVADRDSAAALAVALVVSTWIGLAVTALVLRRLLHTPQGARGG